MYFTMLPAAYCAPITQVEAPQAAGAGAGVLGAGFDGAGADGEGADGAGATEPPADLKMLWNW